MAYQNNAEVVKLGDRVRAVLASYFIAVVDKICGCFAWFGFDYDNALTTDFQKFIWMTNV